MRKLLITLLFFMLAIACLPANAADDAVDDTNVCLMYSTLLNGVKMLPDTGQFHMDGIQAVFLPEAQSASGMIYPYNPDDGGKLWAILSEKGNRPNGQGGKQLYRFDFYAEMIKSPYWLLNSYRATDMQTKTDAGMGYVDLATPGSYVLNFYLKKDDGTDDLFYTFEFSVRKVRTPNPLAGGDRYVLDGPWENWGYFYYLNADPTRQLQFKVWLRSPEHGNVDCKPVVEIYRGGNLIATGREKTFTLRPEWVRYEFDFVFPKDHPQNAGQCFNARDMFVEEDSYVLKLKLGNKEYEWSFAIVNGKFEYANRADHLKRDKDNKTTFIEGGLDAWWYERNK